MKNRAFLRYTSIGAALGLTGLSFLGCQSDGTNGAGSSSSGNNTSGGTTTADGGVQQQPPAPHEEWKCDARNTTDVGTDDATPLGLMGFTANGCIEPRGEAMQYYFEYGLTEAYGSKTPVKDLSPKRAAFYAESWNAGLSGWAGGMNGTDLTYEREVPTNESTGYVKFKMPSGDDPNHVDGIGFLQLAEYLYIGTYIDEVFTTSLGGGDPDFRDAQVSVSVRGNSFVPRGSEVVFWAQADADLAQQNDENWRRANWAHTGFLLTDAALAGGWKRVSYELENDSRAWSYGGQSTDQQRPNYQYAPIHEVLAHLNCDIFHLLTFVNIADTPSGTLDFDDMEIAYRNHSLVFPSNGGKLVSVPAGSTDAAKLTDGWRNGAGHTWQSAANPSGPIEIDYDFELPVDVDVVQIHQDPEFPSKDIEVLLSDDGVSWTTIASGTLPDVSPRGPNFAHFLQRDIQGARGRHAKVRILSGYQSTRWGLGEIELFGRGAEKKTDDAWYHVNLDVTGLEPGKTYHYRLVTQTKTKTVQANDRTFTVPAIRKPLVATGIASRVGGGKAKLEGRLTALGKATDFWFEYGTDTTYGAQTANDYGGIEQTPRTANGALEGLTPGVTYHYRLVAKNETGISYGLDASFVAK